MFMKKKTFLSLLVLIVILGALWLGLNALKKMGGPAGEEGIVLNAYFPNIEMGSGEDCSKVFPVERTVSSTEAVGAAAVAELLKGPAAEEESEGYFTSLPGGVILNVLNIEEGTAYADFNEVLNEGGGSCMMVSRSSQITETLKQFPDVEDVVISVNGDTETVLQP